MAQLMNKKYTYFIVIFLIVVSFIAFSRILGNGFVSFDDYAYITENNHIQSGLDSGTIKWAFSAVVLANWHPLTLLSHVLDWSLFGANASGHHLVNLLLHIGSVLFLFFFLEKTTKSLWPSAFVAALFALHPLRVESVAWAAERKDVLSMFFGMATIYVYAFYVEEHKLSRYFLCLTLFALGLMVKPMLVTLPFVLMLLDYWPLGRWQNALAPVKVPVAVSERSGKKKTKQRKAESSVQKKIARPVKSDRQLIGNLLWEKLPFIFLAIILSIGLIWQQQSVGGMASLQKIPFSDRILNTIVSYVAYLGKIFWPVDLAVFYPYGSSFPFWQILVSCFILIGITIVVIYALKKLPFLFVGWFWYLGVLFPVIGLMQAGAQAMADRYTYFPSIGIAIMLVWGIPLLFQREDMRKKILFPAGIAVLAILAILTWQQCGYWKNSIELFNHALHITKDNYFAHRILGSVLVDEGKSEEAIDHYNEAIRLKPDYAIAYDSRGNAYNDLGQYQRAIEDYNEAIRLKPDYVIAYHNRGIAYYKLGQSQLAIENYNEAIRLKPDYADAYYNRGIAYYKLGQQQRAIEDYNEAIRLKPDLVLAYSTRGIAYYKLGQQQRAIEDYNEAIRLKPTDTDTYNNRGLAYLNQGNNELGCSDAQKACALGNCRLLEVAKDKGLCH
jgi:tetratricopeptide (TPR) repeat protein